MDVSTKAIMDTSRERRRNKRWPEALKREIVAATFRRAHRCRSWRASTTSTRTRCSLASSLSRRRRAVPNVAIDARACAGDDHARAGRDSGFGAATASAETIEIEVGGDYRVRVGSSFDGRALKRVLDVLRKR